MVSFDGGKAERPARKKKYTRLLSLVCISTRWRIRLRRVKLGLRNVVRLLWLAGRRRSVDGSLDGATTLDAVGNEKDPGDELADTANHETGDPAVELP